MTCSDASSIFGRKALRSLHGTPSAEVDIGPNGDYRMTCRLQTPAGRVWFWNRAPFRRLSPNDRCKVEAFEKKLCERTGSLQWRHADLRFTMYRKESSSISYVSETRLCPYAGTSRDDETSKSRFVLSEPATDGRLWSNMEVSWEFLALQKVDNEQMYINCRATEVSGDDTTPRPFFKTSWPSRGPKTVQLVEKTILLATHGYRCL